MLPKFTKLQDSFEAELKQRVSAYFNDNNLKSTGNYKLWTKAIILFVAHVSIYIGLVFYTPSWPLALLTCMLLGLATSGIGFNVMHDGSHGSFSGNKTLNKFAGWSLDLFGGSSYMWKVKHNVAHHTFTNIHGADDDIQAEPFMRMCETQKLYKIHRFQHIYCILTYGLLYFLWVFFFDFKKYFTGMVGAVPVPKLSLKENIIFWGSKVLFIIIAMWIPYTQVGFSAMMIGFLTYCFFTGVFIALVFQLAHVVEKAHFPVVPANGRIADEWAVHQLQTTVNFATDNRFWTWLLGGLNYQVEHHLFPTVSHVHYPAISKIVKGTCADYDVVYNEYPRMSQALVSHVRLLKYLGRN